MFDQAIQEDLSWLGLGWDAILRQSGRADRYETAFARLREAGLAYPCYETPEELAALRDRQRAQGLPPRYARRAHGQGEAQRGSTPYWRLAPARRRARLRRSDHGPSPLRRQRAERPRDRARGRQRHLPVRVRRRRCRAGHHPRHSWRGPCQQHRPAAGDPGRPGPPAAALRPSAADRRRGRPAVLQAAGCPEPAQPARAGHRALGHRGDAGGTRHRRMPPTRRAAWTSWWPASRSPTSARRRPSWSSRTCRASRRRSCTTCPTRTWRRACASSAWAGSTPSSGRRSAATSTGSTTPASGGRSAAGRWRRW